MPGAHKNGAEHKARPLFPFTPAESFHRIGVPPSDSACGARQKSNCTLTLANRAVSTFVGVSHCPLGSYASL
jgi:hypothetical protein